MTTVKDLGLTIVPAGAGAGKTHLIKTTLSAWVKKELVSPERILAVTFTEAAASGAGNARATVYVSSVAPVTSVPPAASTRCICGTWPASA